MENTAKMCTQNKIEADSFPHPLRFATAPANKTLLLSDSIMWFANMQHMVPHTHCFTDLN
jgi:hypothetical protein